MGNIKNNSVERLDLKGLSQEFTIPTDSKEEVGNIRLTTRNEILGFYGYAVAYLPYTLASANFVPLMISAFAKQAGYSVVDGSACNFQDPRAQCYVIFNTLKINTSSFAMYTNSLGVAIQAAGLILFSALADTGPWRSHFILGFTIIGGLVSSLYAAIKQPNLYWVLALFSLLSNIAAGMGSAYYFSYIPVLVRNHPEVVEAKNRTKQTIDTEGFDLVTAARDRVANRISGYSLALGLVASSIVIFVAYGFGRNSSSGVLIQQIGASMAGAWWLIVGIFSWFLLPKTPGPNLPSGHSALTHSIKTVWRSLLEIGSAWYIWLGLLSWFFLSDALNTLLMVTIFVGSSSLGVTGSESLLLSGAAPLAEAIGIVALTCIKNLIARQRTQGKPIWGCSTKGMTLFLCVLCTLLTAWGLVGNYSTKFGIKSKPEYYAYFTITVTLYACLQSFHRVMFSELVPSGREAEFFGLYLICYRGTSWIGNLVVGAIKQATGEDRLGYIFVLGLFISGMLAILPIDVEKAHRHSASLARRH